MHVVYSGTVGAAREGAMLGIPALALSLDNYRGPPDYRHAATIAAALIRAVLGLLPLPGLRPYEQAAALQSLRGTVINVNFPMRSLEDTKVRARRRREREPRPTASAPTRARPMRRACS